MQVVLGHDDFSLRQKNSRIPITWDSDKVVNGHILMVGRSGSGKSFTLKKFMDQAQRQMSGGRIHVFDVHGDLEVNNASSVIFSESTDYGMNPLRISANPHSGGCRKRIQSFIGVLNRAGSRSLGSRQEAVLRNLLMDLYIANGFYPDRPDSWGLKDGGQRTYAKKYPTIEDAVRFCYSKIKMMYLGADSKSVKALEDLNRKASSIQTKLRKLNGAKDSEVSRLEADLAKLADDAVETYAEYVKNIKTGHELDALIKYDSQEVIRSVYERLENLKATGLFKSKNPPFDMEKRIWRYALDALNEEEKKLFVEFRCQEIFTLAMERGPVPGIDQIIVLDEGHNYFGEDCIIDKIAKEGRKFGIALICASQSPTHFSEDFLGNVATKIILGLDPMYWDGAIRKMKIEQKTLDYLTPQKTIAVQITNKGDLKSPFRQVSVAG